MVVCECILSENSVKHVEILQKILCMDSGTKSNSEILSMLLRYVVADPGDISIDDLILIDDYFSKHPAFLNQFYTDVMTSAIFYSNSS